MGISRIASARLHAIALALGTDVAFFFFDDTEPNLIVAGQLDHQRRLVELMHNIQRIPSLEHRHAVCDSLGRWPNDRRTAGGTRIARDRWNLAPVLLPVVLALPSGKALQVRRGIGVPSPVIGTATWAGHKLAPSCLVGQTA